MKNTMKLFFRRKGNIILLISGIIIPLFFLLFTYGGSGQLRIGVVDKDKSLISQDLINSLGETDKFKVVFLKEDEINDKVSKGKVDSAIVIPQKFEEGILKGNPKDVEIVSIKGEEATLFLKSYLDRKINVLYNLARASYGNEESFYRMYNIYKNNPFRLQVVIVQDISKTAVAITRSLGFFIMFLMFSTFNISNFILVEKRDKTFYRIFASPLKPKTYLVSNFLLNLIMTVFQIAFVLLFVTFILNLGFTKATFDVFLVLVSFGIASIGLSSMIVSFSPSTSYSNTLSTLIIIPTCMLGGVFWPLYLMPETLQKLSDFIPQKWAIDAIEKIQMGGSLSNVYIDIIILLAFALTFILLGIYKIKTSEKMGDFI
ncbi:ABC transporter permease [Caldanaerobacter sp.]|uniref:ABC transporter permease n=1 Tax=Caldanaerobacter sp. TaxID=2930036 RepID=UPI003C70F854